MRPSTVDARYESRLIEGEDMSSPTCASHRCFLRRRCSPSFKLASSCASTATTSSRRRITERPSCCTCRCATPRQPCPSRRRHDLSHRGPRSSMHGQGCVGFEMYCATNDQDQKLLDEVHVQVRKNAAGAAIRTRDYTICIHSCDTVQTPTHRAWTMHRVNRIHPRTATTPASLTRRHTYTWNSGPRAAPRRHQVALPASARKLAAW